MKKKEDELNKVPFSMGAFIVGAHNDTNGNELLRELQMNETQANNLMKFVLLI